MHAGREGHNDEPGSNPGSGGSVDQPGENQQQPIEDEAKPVDTSAAKEQVYYTLVRYSRIRMRDLFTTTDDTLKKDDWVMAQTPRGVEQGLVITSLRTTPFSATDDNENTEPAGRILRLLKKEEIEIPWHETGRFTKEYQLAVAEIKELGLPMKLTDIEILPRRDKGIFYFLADGRVDFRQLVRSLARSLHLRVEMKQIGVRDEARLKGTCGHCGRGLCCSSWMHKMEPVNMRMAKVQKTTLDPDKISGRCGRLLCCLRYEAQTYWENRKIIPARGTEVNTPSGPGRVIQQDLLSCRVLVDLDKGEKESFELCELGKEGEVVERKKPCASAPSPSPIMGKSDSIMPAPFAEELLGSKEDEDLGQTESPRRDSRKKGRSRRRRRKKS